MHRSKQFVARLREPLQGPQIGMFGWILRQHRQRLGLIGREIAHATGIDQSWISRIESGARIPPDLIPHVLLLANALGISDEILKEFVAAAYFERFGFTIPFETLAFVGSEMRRARAGA